MESRRKGEIVDRNGSLKTNTKENPKMYLSTPLQMYCKLKFSQLLPENRLQF